MGQRLFLADFGQRHFDNEIGADKYERLKRAMGAQRICNFLYENGVQGRKKHGFPNMTINRLLKNPIYTGVIRNGNAQSEPIEELRIIDDAIFARAQTIMKDVFSLTIRFV